eukprot:11292908-Heterocapsa_arctica.AAC.1
MGQGPPKPGVDVGWPARSGPCRPVGGCIVFLPALVGSPRCRVAVRKRRMRLFRIVWSILVLGVV